MTIKSLEAGRDVPNDINVVIEIPSHSDPIKYELDKKTGMLMVDRFVATSMHYPCEYGFVPNTLSEDGDPVDVLVVAPFKLSPGVVIRCRPIGALRMTDESGVDTKILAVPIDKLTALYRNVHKPEDLGAQLLASIEHFFQHYKDLEPGKWVKTNGWEGPEAAKAEILASIERHKAEA
jgi:inorganic pyrophosphatase